MIKYIKISSHWHRSHFQRHIGFQMVPIHDHKSVLFCIGNLQNTSCKKNPRGVFSYLISQHVSVVYHRSYDDSSPHIYDEFSFFLFGVFLLALIYIYIINLTSAAARALFVARLAGKSACSESTVLPSHTTNSVHFARVLTFTRSASLALAVPFAVFLDISELSFAGMVTLVSKSLKHLCSLGTLGARHDFPMFVFLKILFLKTSGSFVRSPVVDLCARSDKNFEHHTINMVFTV